MKKLIVEICLVVSIYSKKKIFFSYFSFLAGSTFDITSTHHEIVLPTTSSPTQIETILPTTSSPTTQIEPIHNDNIGNFNVTIDDLFPASQASQLSPTLQINDVKSQQNNLFDDDDMD